MRICGISDTHGNLLSNIPECDVLCIAGDVITLNAQRNFDASEYWWKNRFVPWVMGLPCKKVLVVPGNHDIYLENLFINNKWEEFCDYMAITTEGKLHFLINQSFEYNKIKFYGMPWIKPIPFQENKWAFQSGKIDDYHNIPECDVLITHDNPFHNIPLRMYGENKSEYWFYGHWHDGESDETKGWYNCSRLDDCYNFKKDYKYTTIVTMEKNNKIVKYLFNLIDELKQEGYDEETIDFIYQKMLVEEGKAKITEVENEFTGEVYKVIEPVTEEEKEETEPCKELYEQFAKLIVDMETSNRISKEEKELMDEIRYSISKYNQKLNDDVPHEEEYIENEAELIEEELKNCFLNEENGHNDSVL